MRKYASIILTGFSMEVFDRKKISAAQLQMREAMEFGVVLAL